MTRSKFVVAVAVLGPFVWFFGPVLLQARTFGFRDAANYYYPLFHWECGEWAAGRIPLWNPLDNAGTPVLADTTSSVLYPGKLVFALPVSYRLRYHIYITMHLLLAAVTMYGLARRWRLSGEAAGLAAVSFAFGGSVVFQYCNVVFLVGAAWLPASLYAADRALCERSVFWSVLLGAVLALMTLGGDPQAAYHTGLLVAAYAFFCRRIRTSQDANGRGQQWWSTNLALLAVAAVSGFALALVQILPAIELTRQSDRAMYDEPRSIYEAIYEAALSSNDQTEPQRLTGIFKTPQPGTHLRHAYYYSMGPWHLVELGWPNISGRHYPKNQRWVTALPAEGRIWTPSLYAGLLPIVLGIGSWRIRKGDPQIRFLSWVTGIAVLASFGWYGLGWLWNELEGAVSSTAPHQAWIGDPVGGVYWFFVVLLPGYVNFRYPAKWLPVAALGISLLAARGWDRWREGEWPLRAWLFAIAAVSLAGAAVFAGGHANWMAFVHQAPPDAIFGPLDVEAATRDVLSAFAHTAVVSLGAVILLSRRWALSSQTLGQLVVLLTAVDLCVANGWMALTIDGDVLERSNGFAETIAANDAHADGPAPRLWRTNPAGLLPRAWSRVGSDLRMQDVVAWERSTLLPTHHLDQGVAILEAHTTLRQRDWASLERVMREFRSTTPQGPRQLERWEPLSSEFVLAPHSKTLAGCEAIAHADNGRITLWRERRAYPRVWINHSVEVKPPLVTRSRREMDQRTRAVWEPSGAIADFRAVGVIEAVDFGPPLADATPEVQANSTCKITHYDAQRVEIEASLTAAGVLVLNDAFYPGWQAQRITEGRSQPLTIYRANRVMRAIRLPAGTHRVKFTYRPASVLLGGSVSLAAWLALALVAAVRFKRKCDRGGRD